MWAKQLKSLKVYIFKHVCSMASISCSLNSISLLLLLLYYCEKGGRGLESRDAPSTFDMTASQESWHGNATVRVATDTLQVTSDNGD